MCPSCSATWGWWDSSSTIKRFAAEHALDLVRFESGHRKDDVAAEYLERFDDDEGVLFVGVAQEKARV